VAVFRPQVPPPLRNAMSETPRLKSAFPQTPRIRQRLSFGDVTSLRKRETNDNKEVKLPPGVQRSSERSSVVPVEVVDAASQRFYAAAVYAALTAWRLFDSWGASDDLDSTWLFLKWVFIDGVFIFALQSLRIPWMEWTFPTCFTIFLLHSAVNTFLMFHIPVSHLSV
jgi:nucleoporin POM152